jgi:hypothetical protein
MKKKYLMIAATVAAPVVCGIGWTTAPQVGFWLALFLHEGIVGAILFSLVGQLIGALLGLPDATTQLLVS